MNVTHKIALVTSAVACLATACGDSYAESISFSGQAVIVVSPQPTRNVGFEIDDVVDFSFTIQLTGEDANASPVATTLVDAASGQIFYPNGTEITLTNGRLVITDDTPNDSVLLPFIDDGVQIQASGPELLSLLGSVSLDINSPNGDFVGTDPSRFLSQLDDVQQGVTRGTINLLFDLPTTDLVQAEIVPGSIVFVPEPASGALALVCLLVAASSGRNRKIARYTSKI